MSLVDFLLANFSDQHPYSLVASGPSVMQGLKPRLRCGNDVSTIRAH